VGTISCSRKVQETAQQSEKDEYDSEGDNDSADNNNSGYDDKDDNDDNDDSGGSISDAVNEGNNDVNREEGQRSDILCTTKSSRTCRTWKGSNL